MTLVLALFNHMCYTEHLWQLGARCRKIMTMGDRKIANPIDEAEEAELIKQLRHGDSTAIEKLYNAYFDRVYSLVFNRVGGNQHAAEDIVQETFLAALKARKGFSGLSSERTWLIGILKHKIVDIIRKKYKEIPVSDLQHNDQEAIDSFFDYTEHPKKFPSNWIPNPRELIGNNEFWEVLEECLKKLPKATADAFTMREIDKMKTEEICKVLGLSPTNRLSVLKIRNCSKIKINYF